MKIPKPSKGQSIEKKERENIKKKRKEKKSSKSLCK
jgi:hypothetical protein